MASALGMAAVPVPVGSADPVACSTFLHSYASDGVDFTLVSNQSTGFVGCAEGGFAYSGVSRDQPAALSGAGTQYFSDGRGAHLPDPTTPPPHSETSDQPFDEARTDQPGVTVVPSAGMVTLSLLSWGGGQIPISDPACEQGALLGSGDGTSTLFALSLTNNPPPPITE